MRAQATALGLVLLIDVITSGSGCTPRRTAAQRPTRRASQQPTLKRPHSPTDELILRGRVPARRAFKLPVPLTLTRPRLRPAAGLLDVSLLLDAKDIFRLLGSNGPFQVGRLASPKRSATVDSLHFKARGQQGEEYDLAFRVWRLQKAALERKFDFLRKALPKARLLKEVADRSLTAISGSVRGYAFLDRKSEAVVLLSCGVQLCLTHAMILRVARLLHKRLPKLSRTRPR